MDEHTPSSVAEGIGTGHPEDDAMATARALAGGSIKALVVSTTPAPNGSIGGAEPLSITFRIPVLDADPALTDASGNGYELDKQWNQEHTQMTCAHPPLPPGVYTAVLEGLFLSDGSGMEEDAEMTFTVTA